MSPISFVVRAVVVATGASEVVLPFPGWELPGVTTVGAAQALLKGQGVVAGRRVLVAGSGPLLLPAAAGLAEAGVHVVAVLEANRVTPGRVAGAARLAPFSKKVSEAGGYGRILGRHRVPVRAGYAVTACQGDGRVEQATISRVDRDWRPVPGTGRQVPVDAVHVSFGFSPALELTAAAGVRGPAPGRAAGRGHLVRRRPGDVGAGGVRGRGDDRGGRGRRRGAGRLCGGASAARYLGTRRRGTE